MISATLLRSRMTGNCHVRFWSRVRRGDLPGLDNTISCRSTNLIECLVVFEKFNCKMNGFAQVKTGWKLMDGSKETIPALKMRIG